MFSIDTTSPPPCESALQSPPSLTFKSEIQIFIDLIKELFDSFIKAIKTFNRAHLESKKIVKSEPQVTKPMDVNISTPIHGMYALKSVREIIKTLHEENLFQFKHKSGSSIEYSFDLVNGSVTEIRLLARQKDSDGNTLELKAMSYQNSTDREIGYFLRNSLKNSYLSGIRKEKQLHELTTSADNDKINRQSPSFFDEERENERQILIANYSHKPNHLARDAFIDAALDFDETEDFLKKSSLAEEDRAIFQKISDPNFRLEENLKNLRLLKH
jgi:hypothetical protein